MAVISKIYSVFLKDFKSELRSRYAISSVLLFVLIVISIVIFSAVGEEFTSKLTAAFIWIIIFFSSMTGLSKSFVSEEERKTLLLLQSAASPPVIYFGKLLFNNILSLFINASAVILFLLFTDIDIVSNPAGFIITILLGSIGIASATTVISSIIAKASSKNALFPVLSFPLLLPLIILGIESTELSFSSAEFAESAGNFPMMIAYSGIVIAASFLLIETILSE